MKIKQALLWGAEKLKTAKIQTSQLDAELILSDILNQDRSFLFTYPEKEVKKNKIAKFKSLIARRLSGESVALINGYKYFYGLKFLVTRSTLIPRPETELMVEKAINLNLSKKFDHIIDMGTGTGCIAISLAKNIPRKKIVAVDISARALKIAQKNSKFNLIKNIEFIKSDLLKSIPSNKLSGRILITANLPYLTPEQYNNSPSIYFEPKLALISGKDGLLHYRRLLSQIKNSCFLKTTIYLLLEIDDSQKDNISRLIKESGLPIKHSIHKDLAGLNRLVEVKIN